MTIRLVLIVLAMSVVSCRQADEPGSSLAIVGGEAVRADDPVAKTTVSLVKGRHSFCTGVVIAPRFVLTAAHCMENVPTGNFHVYFGLVARPEAITDDLLVEVDEIKSHEAYQLDEADLDPDTGFAKEPVNDIALVELRENALASPVAPVPADAVVKAGDPIVLAGFGKTAAVNGSTGELRVVETAFGAELRVSKEVEIQRGPLNSCDGDSGGPLYLKTDEGFALLGILSRGDPECQSIGVYTDVRDFQQWITDSMNTMAQTVGKEDRPVVAATPTFDGPSVPPML